MIRRRASRQSPDSQTEEAPPPPPPRPSEPTPSPESRPRVLPGPSRSPFQGEYNELSRILSARAWIVYLFLIVAFGLIFGLSLEVSRPYLALIAIAFCFALSLYVILPNRFLWFRHPINWLVTAFLIASLTLPSLPFEDYSSPQYLAALAIWIFAAYWFVSAILWTRNFYSTSKSASSAGSTMSFFATLLLVWGLALQLAFLLGSVLLPLFLPPRPEAAPAAALVEVSHLLAQSSLLSFLPLGLLGTGFAFFVILRFQEDPPPGATLSEIPLLSSRPLLRPFAQALRLPLLILLVFYRFLRHFILLSWTVIEEFVDTWLARIIFLFTTLILAPTLLLSGHYLVVSSFRHLGDYLSGDVSGRLSFVLFFLLFHLALLLALTLYSLSVGLLAIPCRGQNSREILRFLRPDLVDEGGPPLIGVINAFSSASLVLIAVPLTSYLPGAPGFGAFSWAYSVLLGAVAIGSYRVHRRKNI